MNESCPTMYYQACKMFSCNISNHDNERQATVKFHSTGPVYED
jgi:hypothetical protein